MARRFILRLVVLLVLITPFAGWNLTSAQGVPPDESVQLAAYTFSMTAIRSCEDNSLSLQWTTESLTGLTFSLHNTSDSWYGGSNTVADLFAGAYAMPVEHSFDKINIVVQLADGSSWGILESYDIDVGACGVLATSTQTGVAEPEATINITGTVTDDDGNPLEGVTVWLSHFQRLNIGYETVTDANGAYAFNEIPKRHYYSILASQLEVPGVALYIPQGRPDMGIIYDLGDGNVVVDFEFTRFDLVQRGSVSGTIKDDSGTPLAGAGICLYGGPLSSPCITANLDGTFLFTDVANGQYRLSATVSSETGNFVAYSISTWVTVASEDVDRDIVFVRAIPGTATINVAVIDEHGEAIDSAEVCYWDNTCAPVDSTGSLVIADARHGAFSLFVMAPGYFGTSAWLVVDQSPFAVTIVLSERGVTKGTLQDTNGTPVAGASICHLAGKASMYCAESDEGGRFIVPAQGSPEFPTLLAITADGCTTAYAQAIGGSGGLVDLGVIQLQCGGPVEPDVAIVRGQVVDDAGDPLAGADVCLDGAETCVSTDGDGNYSLTFEELPGGSGTFIASLDGYESQSQLVIGVVPGRDVVANFVLAKFVAPEPDPVATLSTARVQPAAAVGWTVSDAGANAGISIEWVTSSGSTIALGASSADATGNAAGTFAAPATPGGVGHRVRFTIGSKILEVPIEVAARISPSPKSGVPGQTISVNLRGFAANDNVQILWRVNGAWVPVAGSVRTSPTGSVTGLQLMVPANAEAGANTIRVSGTISQQSSAFTVIRPTASLDSTRATVGTKVDFTLSDFPANSPVEITWVRTNGVTVARGSVTTDASGAAVGKVEVPAAEGGAGHQVRFVSGAATATATFEIAARIRATPTVARPGETVSLNLRGFRAGDPVRIMWRNGQGSFVQVGSAVTSPTGSVTGLEIVVPGWAPNGVNTLRANGTISGQTSALTIESPSVVVTPESGIVNTTVTYALSRFPANRPVIITWNRLTGGTVNLGTVTTDATGSAGGTFRIPATPGGAGQIVTFASGSVSTSAMIAVNPRVKVTPSVAVPGETIDISLRGLPRQEPYVIRWRAGTTGAFTVIAIGTTSNTGSANIAFVIPLNAQSGPYQVRVEMAPYNLQTNAFSVGNGD